MVRQVPFPQPTPEDPAGAAASGPAGTVGTSFPLTPLGSRPFHNAFATSKDTGCGFLRRKLLAGSNPRMRAHNVFDGSGHAFLEKLRDEEWRNAKEFETAVGLLLFFLGFQVDPLSAQKGMGNAVDHLAFDPGSSMILAVECTVGPPDGGGKLGKLIARSEDVRSQLPDSRGGRGPGDSQTARGAIHGRGGEGRA